MTILLYPLMQGTALERGAFRVVGLLLLGATLYVVKRGPWLTGFAVLLVLPVVVISTWFELLFLSFTTLSAVGLGDIVPVLPMARASELSTGRRGRYNVSPWTRS